MLDELFRERLELLPVEDASHRGVEVLGDVEVAHELVRELHAPDPRQVPNDVADRGKEHAVETVQAPVEPELDGAPRDVADVGLVERVAPDDLHVVAAAENGDGKGTLGVKELAGNVNGHVADGRARVGLLPTAHFGEAIVAVDLLRPGGERLGAVERSEGQWFLHAGARLSINARIPSAASSVAMSSSR